MSAVTTKLKTGKSLVDASIFGMLAERVARDEQIVPEQAVRVVDQALAFLATCAVSGVRMSPSKAIDPGWHAFILHTNEYETFCQQVAGRFIHHVPADQSDSATRGAPARAAIEQTKAEMLKAGFVVDDELWQPPAADCSQCHSGCTDSPTDV
jgi:hypothetical protein